VNSCQFAKRIEAAVRAGEIIVDDNKRKLLLDDGSEDIFL